MDPEVVKAFEEAMREVEEDLRLTNETTMRGVPVAEREALGAARVVNARSARLLQQMATLEDDIASVRALTMIQVQRLDQARLAAERAKALVVEAMRPHIGDQVRLTAAVTWEDYENTTWYAREGLKGKIVSVGPSGDVMIRLDGNLSAPSVVSPGRRQYLDTIYATPEDFKILKRAPVPPEETALRPAPGSPAAALGAGVPPTEEVAGKEGLTPSEVLALRALAEGKTAGPQGSQVLLDLEAKGIIDASGNLTEKGVSALPSWMKR